MRPKNDGFAQDLELQGLERGRPAAANVPPFRSMEELMDGELSYVVAVPNTPEAALTVQVLFFFFFFGDGSTEIN